MILRLSFLSLLALAGCSSTKKGMTADDPGFKEIARQESARKAGKSYIIGVGDVLRTTVYDKFPFSGERAALESPVRDDQTVVVPALGKVKIESMTLLQVEELLTQKLAEHVKHPFVVVELLKTGSRKAYIFGEVFRPGVVPLGGTDALLDVLAAGGGATDKAHLGTVTLIRPRMGQSKIYDLSLKRVVGEGRVSENVWVEDGDIIYVPRSPVQSLDRVLRMVGQAVPVYFLANSIYGNLTE